MYTPVMGYTLLWELTHKLRPPTEVYYTLICTQVWDYLSGDCLKVLSGATVATEVTAMLHMLDRSQFLSVGWNGRIITFMDKADVRERRNTWMGRGFEGSSCGIAAVVDRFIFLSCLLHSLRM